MKTLFSLPIRSVFTFSNPQNEGFVQHWLTIAPEYFFLSLEIMKRSHLFKATTLLDIWSVDEPHLKNRHTLFYSLQSLFYNKRFIISFPLDKPLFYSVVPLYPSAGWLEREVWDMHGIFFQGHTDLRRILTDYGFIGFPLRKDFPLGGFTEIRYVEEMQACVYEPVIVAQEFRLFDYSSPWLKHAKK